MRDFACDQYAFMPKDEMKRLRQEAQAAYQPEAAFDIGGSDIDADALALCEKSTSVRRALNTAFPPKPKICGVYSFRSRKGFFFAIRPMANASAIRKVAVHSTGSWVCC